MRVAENDSIKGGYNTVFGLSGFIFDDIDLTGSLLSGISITVTGAGASRYEGMTNGLGTQFTFAKVPEPSSLSLFILLLIPILWPVMRNHQVLK